VGVQVLGIKPNSDMPDAFRFRDSTKKGKGSKREKGSIQEGVKKPIWMQSPGKRTMKTGEGSNLSFRKGGSSQRGFWGKKKAFAGLMSLAATTVGNSFETGN